VQAGSKIVKASVPAETPVEILFKPKPAYTPEARERKIEGEVQLDVVFSANGQIHVMRVVRGLGMGLDESARAAASQIRFRPGTKDGNPVDIRGIVHIVFELS
jgi:TonB family protein